MSKPKSLLSSIGLLLGVVGLVLCIAVLVIVWITNQRIKQLNENVFGKLDMSLLNVQQRVVQIQDRVAAAKITAGDVEQALRNWTKREMGQRVAVQVNALDKIERLSSALQQADHWLDVSQTSIEGVQQVLSIDPAAEARPVMTTIDELMNELAGFRSQMDEAIEFVAKSRERVANVTEEKSSEERGQQARQLIVRVVASLGSLDSHIEKINDRLSVAQSNTQELKARTQWWIRAAMIGVALLIVLMAAGQVALCRLCYSCGAKRYSRY